MIGQTLNNRYKITARLGKGAMGTVYRAVDTQKGEEVAVKIISGEVVIDAELLERFKREAETLRQLKHPNIVGFIDAFQFDESYVIIMEYISKGSLHDLIKAGPLPVEHAIQVTLDLCDALIRAHRLNIIHRDLKPENILMGDDGVPRLADFGVARLSEGTRMTRSGTQVGTPYYMAPEAWEGLQLDAQADIWSLGVIMFEMLTGQVPFAGDTGPAVMKKVLTAKPPNLKNLRYETPSEIETIIQKMLARDKNKRYESMRQLAADLERVKVAPAKSLKFTSSTRRLYALAGAGLFILISTVWLFTRAGTAQIPGANRTDVPPASSMADEASKLGDARITAGTLLFDEDFEDSAIQGIGFSAEPGGKIVTDGSGNRLYEFDNRAGDNYKGFSFGADEWTDYSVQYRVRILNSSENQPEVGLQVRSYANSYYVFVLGEEALYLAYSMNGSEWTRLSTQFKQIDRDSWQDMNVIVAGEQISVYLNNVLLINAESPQIRQGYVMIFLGVGTIAQFDDIRVVTVDSETSPSIALEPTPASTDPNADLANFLVAPEDDMGLLYVPAGKFTMGTDSGSEGPAHLVDLAAFWIDQTEITNAMYTKCVTDEACNPPTDSDAFSDASYTNHPVAYVTWSDARNYCEWANRRLPTEAEWEKAARGENGFIYPWGDDIDCDRANHNMSCAAGTVPVGSYESGKSPYGVYDMSGNVWEWVSSLYDSYPYSATDGRESLIASGIRVLRGGSWADVAFAARTVSRNPQSPEISADDVGFRCAMSP